MLTYGKTNADIRRGRVIGKINVGLSVISAKTELCRIDIDDEECIHHIKVRLGGAQQQYVLILGIDFGR